MMRKKNQENKECGEIPIEARAGFKCFMDALLRLRPGALKTNVALLLALVKQSAKAGHAALYLQKDAVRGGDCGTLNGHPAFVKALARAEEAFANALKKIKDAPTLVFVDKGAEPSAMYGTTSAPFGAKAYPLLACEKASCSILPEPLLAEENLDPRFPFGGRPKDVFGIQTLGFARRLAAIGCKDVVIGLSGGLDSALALLVTCEAFRMLGYGSRGIHVYTMPGFGTTKRTRGNADLLCEGLGLKLETIDITPACRQHFMDIRQPQSRHDVTFENAQARERTQILMDKANQFNGIVAGTGDMSEIALGWCTFNGDHMSMFGVNAGVPKTVVREVCHWWAMEHPGKAADALLDIIATPVSPELLPAKRGKIAQRTEDKVGPYELHDFFLWHFAYMGKSPKEVLSVAKRAFKGRYDAATMAKWLKVFLHRLHGQSFKRNCAPDGVRVFRMYFSPDAWHLPSDVSTEWLAGVR